MKKSRKPAAAPTLNIGDKVWWYDPEVVMEVINVNATHAHIRNAHGALYWVRLEELKKVAVKEEH
jgi:hypothetical protein